MVAFRLVLIFFFGGMLVAEGPTFSLAKIQRHSTANDCWIVIDRDVYDITKYLIEHTSEHTYDLSKWCGKDSSQAWRDKDGKNKPHSRKAENLLKKYRIGSLQLP